MNEDLKFELSQIIMKRMELKSYLDNISYLMNIKPNKNFSKEINSILDDLKYLETLEHKIREKIKNPPVKTQA